MHPSYLGTWEMLFLLGHAGSRHDGIATYFKIDHASSTTTGTVQASRAIESWIRELLFWVAQDGFYS